MVKSSNKSKFCLENLYSLNSVTLNAIKKIIKRIMLHVIIVSQVLVLPWAVFCIIYFSIY